MSNPEVDIAKLQVEVSNLRRELHAEVSNLGRDLERRDALLNNRMDKADAALKSINAMLTALDVDAKRMRFGLAVLAGIGGVAGWLISVADSIKGWFK